MGKREKKNLYILLKWLDLIVCHIWRIFKNIFYVPLSGNTG